MPIVVGFVPTKEGRAALARAAEESALRSTKLVIVNSHRGGRDAVDVGPESPTEKELACGQADSGLERPARPAR